jgi:hypothetical protein
MTHIVTQVDMPGMSQVNVTGVPAQVNIAQVA